MINSIYIYLNKKIAEVISTGTEEEVNIENNDLVFKAPRLSGYGIVGLNRLSVYSNNIKSQSGGPFAHYMKCNGYDYIIIKGKSYKQTHIHIDKNSIEFIDSFGMNDDDFLNTKLSIEHKLKNKNIEIATVGLAGVKGIDFSSIMFDKKKSCGKNGLGKLMGSKNLKSISLEKHIDLIPQNSKELVKLNEIILNRISQRHTLDFFKDNNSCYGCCLNCKSTVINKILKFEFSYEEAKEINQISDRYGMDSIDFANILKQYRKCNNYIYMDIATFAKNYIGNHTVYNHLHHTKNIVKDNNETSILVKLGFCKILNNKDILNENEIEALIECTVGS
ncbi:MAG: aldehyde ferredoxin oxidoreductase N-terminal domain-containing protein [Peptostreptococcaceae bacterium]